MNEREQIHANPKAQSFSPLARPNLLQRKCACGGAPGVDGECAECRNRRPKRGTSNPAKLETAPPIVHETLGSPGQPLDAGNRALMESRFGHDFSKVRVHTGTQAAESVQAVNALAYTVGQDVVFGAGQYAPETTTGRRLLAHELAHIIQQSQGPSMTAPAEGTLKVSTPSDAHEHEAEAQAGQIVTSSGRSTYSLTSAQPTLQRQQTQPGPQSFAEAQPGTQQLDPVLRTRNRDVEAGLFGAAEDYYRQSDLRWFFAYAHAEISRQINQNLSLFQRPNELLRLNIHFAEEWLRAAFGQPHEAWQQAFKRCQALQRASSETSLLVGELEFCGAAMANVHINVDLAAALSEVGCIPPADYGNMLVFVNRGNLAAIARYRGRTVGAAEAILQNILGPKLNLDVQAWRNAAYRRICNTAVTPVQPGFPGRVPR